MNGNRTTDLIIAFAGGLVAGAAAAMLLTPTSGPENRRGFRLTGLWERYKIRCRISLR